MMWVRATLVLFGLALASLARADALDGTYLGLDDADGARIDIAVDRDGYAGTFFDATGQSQTFEADRVQDVAEAVLDMDGRTVLMRMVPRPLGAEVALIPFTAEGALDVAAGLVVAFRHDSVTLPEIPDDYASPPTSRRQPYAANSFVVSYAFWRPGDVATGYLAIPERFRTVIRMFPRVQLDVIAKLCQATNAREALGTALRGQGVTCGEVLGMLDTIQRDGRFDGYKSEVARERETLRLVVRCADNYVESKETCDRASAAVARAAVSLETAATALAAYR